MFIRKAILTVAAATPLVLGMIAALDTSSSAQLVVTCWKTYCIKDPETGQIQCATKTIPCPPEENEPVNP